MSSFLFFSTFMISIFFGLSGVFASDNTVDKGTAAVNSLPIVYVSDFHLDFETIGDSDKGLLKVGKKARDVVNRLGKTYIDPKQKAKEIVDLLADSIVEGLNNRNVISKRIYSSPPPFSDCILLEGDLAEYDEGGRAKRAIIGFGSGSPEMHANITLSEILNGETKILFNAETDAKKNMMPGAAISRNPYVAGAKFVITKNAPEKDVKKIGDTIADKVSEFLTK